MIRLKRLKSIDRDGLILSDLQGEAFELSYSLTDCSTEVFIRRYMNSDIATWLDNKAILAYPYWGKDLIDRVNEEYGVSNYGSNKYTKNELFWIGYIYRYFCYTYDISSRKAYRLIKPKELKAVYFAYHSLSPDQAIERILEAKGLLLNDEDELRRQLNILRKNNK